MIAPALRALALLVLGLAAPVQAQTAPPATPAPAGPGAPMPRDPFGDAAVSRTDAVAQAAARFAVLDADKDGFLSPAELAAARPVRPGGEAGRPRGDGPGPGPGRGGMARMMDANGDGKVARDEYVTATLRRFDLMDTDHDGQLTRVERQAAVEAMRARMAERMAGEAAGAMGGDD